MQEPETIKQPLEFEDKDFEECYEEEIEIISEEQETAEDDIFLYLENIQQEIKNLNSLFNEKIKFDEYKNQMFDNMHKELTDFRNEANEKNINSMALDIIQIMDSYRRLLSKFEQAESSEENYKRLINNFHGILEDLTDVLYRQNIEEYSVENDLVDVKRQKIASTINTDDESLNNTIAERLAPGYEKNQKILRPERISIYKLKK